MTERQDELREATLSAERFDIAPIEDRVAKIPPSPIGDLINRVLPSIPAGIRYDTLVRIRNMRQGALEDLDDPSFQSFLVSYLNIDFSILRSVLQLVRTEHFVNNGCRSNGSLEIAARGSTSDSNLSDEELRELLTHRRFLNR